MVTASCSLLVDLDGYAGDPADAGAAADATFDASPVSDDAAPDATSPPDASAADASASDGASDGASDAAPSSAGDSAASDASAPVCDGGGAPQPDASVTLAPPTADGPPFGGDGGGAFDDTCPAGTALVGLNLVAASASPYSLSQVQGLCAPIVREPCAVTVGASAPLPNHGVGAGASGTLVCPAAMVLVGLRAMTGLFVDSVTLDCAPLASTASSGPLSRGGVSTAGPFGGDGGSPASPYDCPSPMIANQLGGRTGTFLDQLWIGCATPIVP